MSRCSALSYEPPWLCSTPWRQVLFSSPHFSLVYLSPMLTKPFSIASRPDHESIYQGHGHHRWHAASGAVWSHTGTGIKTHIWNDIQSIYCILLHRPLQCWYIYFFSCFHQLTLIVTGAIFTVSIMRPYIFIAAIPLAIIFVLLRKYFLRTGQQLKLLEAEGEIEQRMENKPFVQLDVLYQTTQEKVFRLAKAWEEIWARHTTG